MNILRVGFFLLGIVSFIYGVLGFLSIEVWIRNRGWVKLSQTESIIDFLLGSIILSYMIFMYTRKKPKN